MLKPIVILALVCGTTCCTGDVFAQKTATPDTSKKAESEILFVRRVGPMLRTRCLGCHGADPETIEGSLDVGTLAGLMHGGDSGEPSVAVGQAKHSALYLAATRTSDDWSAMPPKDAEQLSTEQLSWLADWINTGAVWPDDSRRQDIERKYEDEWSKEDGIPVPTSGGLDDEWTNRKYDPAGLWAYQRLNLVDPPRDTHPIDWFINNRLEEQQITPASDATARELVRRISFGLTGLPPATDGNVSRASEFETQFAKNPADAVKQYSQELMAAPQYGEHFGRHWLDVARYADTAGFANDYARPNAWRYRDYVVRAFNNDKPYNEFVREQIAGDEIDDTDPAKRIATGFLRMGPWEQTGMSVFRVTRQQWLDDVTDSVGQAFLGHALQCCKCHDHKFDPLPTRDYYSMMAVFTTTQFAEQNTPLLAAESKAGFAAADEWTKAKITAYSKQEKELQQQITENKTKETGDATVGDNGLSPGDENSLARIKKNISRHQWELEKTQPIAFGVYTGKTVGLKNVNKRLQRPAKPWGRGSIEQDTILTGGDAYTRGETVVPAPISAAITLGGMEPAKFPTGQGKRRLALADWVVDTRNPLTARVMVNRVWSWHFGKGLAGNPNNVGSTGKVPTHPLLLDYLADWFVKHDWSVKQLNQFIITSAAYRRSTRHIDPAAIESKDPTGDSYAVFQPRRLTAEEFRDAMLATSGELNPQVGGIPCRPDINHEVAMQPRQIMGGTASVYEPDPLPAQRNRRSIYAEKIRGLRDPFMETFNQPGPDKSCELRETSTVAPQALTLFNAEEVQDRSLSFAARLLKTNNKSPNDDDTTIVRRAFETALGRPPTAAETSACINHWKKATQEETNKTYPPKTYDTQIKRTVMAEKTGEPYDFIEHMPAYKTYVPDLQPGQTNARTRGLAQVCLVIFNLNEFAYLD